MNKIISRAVLIIEILLAFFFSAIIIDTAITYSNSTEAISTEKIINLIALLSAIVFPLAAHIMIRIKHRSNTPEGEILPFLFLSCESIQSLLRHQSLLHRILLHVRLFLYISFQSPR